MHDILFRIGDRFAIHSYGVMAMIGFLAALFVARWRARRAGLLPDEITDLCVWALLAGIVGSRIAYILQNTDYFFDTRRPGWSVFDLFKIWEGGLVFYGGLIGAMAVTLLLLRARKLKVLPVLDVLAPSLALGQAFGRIGCYLHGCCYGVPVHAGAWYGCVFPRDALPYLSGLQRASVHSAGHSAVADGTGELARPLLHLHHPLALLPPPAPLGRGDGAVPDPLLHRAVHRGVLPGRHAPARPDEPGAVDQHRDFHRGRRADDLPQDERAGQGPRSGSEERPVALTRSRRRAADRVRDRRESSRSRRTC